MPGYAQRSKVARTQHSVAKRYPVSERRMRQLVDWTWVTVIIRLQTHSWKIENPSPTLEVMVMLRHQKVREVSPEVKKLVYSSIEDELSVEEIEQGSDLHRSLML